MKKNAIPTKSLRLSTQTVRSLQSTDLASVAGGGDFSRQSCTDCTSQRRDTTTTNG